jgi:hypothetical protein
MLTPRRRIEILCTLAGLALAGPATTVEHTLTFLSTTSPGKSEWLLFGVEFSDRVYPEVDEPTSPSLEQLAGLIQGSTHVVPRLHHTWSNGADLLLLNVSKPAVALPQSTRFSFDGVQQAASTKTDFNWAALSSQITMSDPDELLHPGRRREWQTDESVRMSVAGPLFFFGQFGASSPSIDEQQPPRWQGKYGVGVKLKPGIVDELQVRGGPTMRSDDTGRLARGPTGEPSEMFLEAVTKVGLPVLGPLNVEYLNTATPSATQHERNLFNQEFRLARPLTGGGQVHVGARYRPDDTPVADSWVDRMQVFMGFELKR